MECWFKTCIFCHIFNFYCPYRGKLYPIIIVLGVNLCYTISVSLCLKIGRAGFRACFPRVDTAVLADRERQHLPRSRRLLHAPPACPRILGRAAIPCRMQPEFCGTMRRSYFIIMGAACVLFAKIGRQPAGRQCIALTNTKVGSIHGFIQRRTGRGQSLLPRTYCRRDVPVLHQRAESGQL